MGFTEGVSTWASVPCQPNISTSTSSLIATGGFINQVQHCTKDSLHSFQIRACLHLPSSKGKQDSTHIAEDTSSVLNSGCFSEGRAPRNSTTCLSWLNSLLSKCSFLGVCNKTCYVQKGQVCMRRLRSHSWGKLLTCLQLVQICQTLSTRGSAVD